MARQNALSVIDNGNTKAKLNEIQAGIIENLQKMGNSFKFKSQNANLNEKAGSYEFKRYKNSASKTYGTARTAHAGDKLTIPPTIVNMDTNREIVEEIAKFDAERIGIDASVISVAERRKTNHQMTMAADIEEAFWKEALNGAISGGKVLAGIKTASGSADIDVQIDEAVVELETTKNDFVRGVERVLIGCVCKPKWYSKLKTKLNECYNANFAVADEKLQGVNGVVILSELYLPDYVDFIIMAKESVAQPLSVDEYDAEKIQLSNDYALEMFYDYGTKTLAPDLIVAGITLDASHTKVAKVAALPTTTNGAGAAAADTIYVCSADSASYNAESDISGSNYPAGTMFTCTIANSTITWTQYNA